jgi:hypothetical protein
VIYGFLYEVWEFFRDWLLGRRVLDGFGGGLGIGWDGIGLGVF